jgi:hypothetical protein
VWISLLERVRVPQRSHLAGVLRVIGEPTPSYEW